MKKELRTIHSDIKMEKRSDEDESMVLRGYAAVFNERTSLGYFDEVILPGAFRNALDEGQDVRALVDHDPSRIIARSKDGGKTGTLRMVEDERGLAVEIDVADTTVGRDLMESVRRGDVSQMSFAFGVRSDDGDEVIEEKSGRILRRLKDLNLFDVSPTTYPAYEGTEIGVRSEVRSITEITEDVRSRISGKEPLAETESGESAQAVEFDIEAVRSVIKEEIRNALKEVIGSNDIQEEKQTEENKAEEVEARDVSGLIAQRKRKLRMLELEEESLES